MFLLAQFGNFVDLSGSQFEGQSLQVTDKTRFLAACGDCHVAAIYGPPQQYLGLANGVLLCQGREQAIQRSPLCANDRSQGSIAGCLDPPFLVERDKTAMLKVRMELDLIDRWRRLGCLKDDLEMTLQEVGHPDRPCLSGLLDCFHSGPGIL